LKKKILITKLDAIGDYILFRNFLYEVRKSELFKNYKIYLLGNKAWRDIALKFDSPHIDKFIWINPSIIGRRRNLIRKIALILYLKILNFSILINPTHSRKKNTESFIKLIKAKKMVASEGDDINSRSLGLINNLNLKYDIISPTKNYQNFEFFRNLSFFEELLKKKLNTKLVLDEKVVQGRNPEIIIFPGASCEPKRWATLNFIKLINYLTFSFPQFKFIIMGGNDIVSISEKILDEVTQSDKLINLTGKTSLNGLIDRIKHSELLISNETSAIHIAAASNTTAICISNGERFGRFSPYPKELCRKIYTVYPSKDFYIPEKREKLIEEFKYGSNVDINKIDVEQVFEVCKKILDKNSGIHNNRN
jgi:ADP-heptose:LPS heptosyltransferase